MSASKYGGRALRRSTAPLRRLPSFLVIGGMRCGSSSLHSWLGGHPDLGLPDTKEVHFFDLSYDRGPSWYRSHFPMAARGAMTFETTPSYLVHPLAPARTANLLPDARLIVLLREPVRRAWSHYRKRRAEGYEPKSFAQAVEPELSGAIPPVLVPFDRVGDVPYLLAGRYAEQLAGWFDAFDRDRLLIIDADRMFAEPSTVQDRILDFVGLRRLPLPLHRVNASPPQEADAAVMDRLHVYYDEPNRRLRALIDEPIGWLDGSD